MPSQHVWTLAELQQILADDWARCSKQRKQVNQEPTTIFHCGICNWEGEWQGAGAHRCKLTERQRQALDADKKRLAALWSVENAPRECDWCHETIVPSRQHACNAPVQDPLKNFTPPNEQERIRALEAKVAELTKNSSPVEPKAKDSTEHDQGK